MELFLVSFLNLLNLEAEISKNKLLVSARHLLLLWEHFHHILKLKMIEIDAKEYLKQLELDLKQISLKLSEECSPFFKGESMLSKLLVKNCKKELKNNKSCRKALTALHQQYY